MIFQQNVCCVEAYNRPYLVTIMGGALSEVKDMNGILVTDPNIRSQIKTVDEAFGCIQNAWSYAEVVNVMYDAVAGYPTYVFVVLRNCGRRN